MEKSINLKDPIAVTFYDDDEPVVYTKLVFREYYKPSNQAMILISAGGNEDDSEALIVTTNLGYPMGAGIVVINVNNILIKQQILPELIKRGLIEKEPCRQLQSGFVTYPAYQLLITDDEPGKLV